MNGLVLSREQNAQFERYVTDLLYWNDRINLISRRDIDNIWLHHILHSISPIIIGVMPKSGKVLDVGTGGGLPGIPLKIAQPNLDMTLIDSIAKKAQTVGMLAGHITSLGLRALRTRVEALGDLPSNHGKYDLVVSRAVAPLVDLIKWSKPLLRKGGRILAYKGGDLTEELQQAQTKYPTVSVVIHEIHVKGTDWFEQEEKKLVEVV